MLYTYSTKGNKKTGPIPITKTERSSCPESCPLMNNGCYAENHWQAKHWLAMNKRNSICIDELCLQIKKLPRGQLWRHNVAGDLPGEGESIDSEQLNKIVAANKGKRGFTYTHKKPVGNLKVLHAAIIAGFCINASANTTEQADYYHNSLDLPTVCLLPTNATEKSYQTEGGNTIVTCPAAIRDNVTCASCAMCADANRSFIIGFPAHGSRKKKADKIACKNI